MRFPVIFALLALLVTSSASAREVEAGSLSASGGLGVAAKLGSTLGASGGYLVLTGQGEYALQSSLTIVGDLSLGLADTKPLRVHAGARYRLTGLELPLSPYAQAQLGYGRLFDVLGANLTYLGLRVGAGADYFLTAKIGVGGLVAFDLGSTTGERPAFFGVLDVLAYATYTF